MQILKTLIQGTHTNVPNQASVFFETLANGTRPSKVKITVARAEGDAESREFELTATNPTKPVPRFGINDLNIFVEGSLEFNEKNRAVIFKGAFSFQGQFTITMEHPSIVVAVL